MTRHVTRMELPEWPGYSISADGCVYGPKSKLKPALTSGYFRVTLCRGTKDRRNVFVHTLVLEAFIGPKPEGQEARHLDGNRTNNDISNLSWSTRLINARDRIAHGTQSRGTLHGRSKLTEEIVIAARGLHANGKSVYSVAKHCGVTDTTMRDVIKRKTWNHVL